MSCHLAWVASATKVVLSQCILMCTSHRLLVTAIKDEQAPIVLLKNSEGLKAHVITAIRSGERLVDLAGHIR